MVNNNGEEADKENGGERGGTPSGTKADHDNNNSDRMNQGDKQNHWGQQEESDSAGDTKDSHREIRDEFERLPEFNEIEHLPVFMAVLKGDLDEIRNKYSEELGSNITANGDTPLNVAIQASCSIHFIRQLVGMLPVKSLERQSRNGLTALHYAAIAGNAEAAKIMVHKNSELPRIKNKFGDTPLHLAAKCGHEEAICFLLSVTPAPSRFDPRAEARLLNDLISASLYGYAFDVIKDHPKTEPYSVKDGKEYVDPNPLTILAQKPEAFESKSQLGFCQRILHYVFPGNSAHKDIDTPESGDEENPLKSSETIEFEQSTYRKGKYSRQKKEIRAVDLLKLLIEEVMKHQSGASQLLGAPLITAARLGNHVFIKMIIQAYPHLVFSYGEDFGIVFHLSVIHRQQNVFSILFQLHAFKHLVFALRDTKSGNNMLHSSGMCKRSRKISGAVLQMQRELQWFKEVEKIVPPFFKEQKNLKGKTPREVFTEEHQDLVKEGEKWMKNAASSCSVVAALVVTVLFAAAITVPGGNNDIGAPHFLDDTKFLIFSVSVFLGLSSSSISLLMFLGMLTSRYAEDDFLEKLPRRLVIGLVTLFFSLAAMLVAFSVSIHILLLSRIRSIWIPIYLIAFIPVVMFGFMQSPLLYEIVQHTYVTPIFHKKPTERIF